MTEIEYKIYIDDIVRRVEFARFQVSEHHIVRTVAVSKYSTSEEIAKLYKIGQRAFGENKECASLMMRATATALNRPKEK